MSENEIIEMIHCNSPTCTQNKGIQLALQKDDLDFVMYHSSDPAYADNCARIFTSLEYQKCARYFDDLFSWIEDLNSPGAIHIFEYLISAPSNLLFRSFVIALEAAVKRKNETMLDILKMILEGNYELESLIKKDINASRWLAEIVGETGDGSVSPKEYE